MSDLVFVSRDTLLGGYVDDGVVPYGSVLLGDELDDLEQSQGETFESFMPGVVPAVNWRGDDAAPVKRGRPAKGS